MKAFIVLLALAAISFSQDVFDETEHLPHFDVSQLSDDFRAYNIPETCSDLSKSCVKGGHAHAKRCISMFYEEKSGAITECRTEQEGLAEASQAWQEASLQWHKNIQACLEGESAPSETEDAADLFVLLFKRSSDQHGHAHGGHDCETDVDHYRSDYENGQECWDDFKMHKQHCKHCILEDDGCQTYAACTGRGPTPEDERLAGWHRTQAKLGKEKLNKIKEAKKLLFTCLGTKADKRR